jgi:uncharacterized protein YndB with AHSA1/START domain
METPIQVTKVFDFPLTTVWDALTKEAALKKWYFDVQDYRFEEGAEFTFYEAPDSKTYLHRCKFLKIVPEKLIEHTWTHPSHSKGTSTVRWELQSEGDKTRVTLTHTGVENFADAGPDFSRANFEMGWKAIVQTNLRNYLTGIEKLVFNIEVESTPEQLWKKLWDKKNYTYWAEPFCPGTYYDGDLKQGGRIHFLTPEGEGMYSDVAYLKENSVVAFSHIGVMKDHKELPVDEETEKWSGSFETYTLLPAGNKTRLKVEVDVVDKYVDYMKETFPLSLERLKESSTQ